MHDDASIDGIQGARHRRHPRDRRRPVVRFGIVTVALFTQLTIKGFATRKEAQMWIESLRTPSISRAG